MSQRISGPNEHVPGTTVDHSEITATDVLQDDGSNKRLLDVRVLTDGAFGSYDTITATYPTALTEVYTYSLNAVDLGNITVTYQDTAKKILLSVVKNAL